MQKAGIADEAAEDGVSHACHRRKNGGGRDAHAADLDTLRYRRAFSGAAGNRSVPVLAHGIILCVSATSEGQNQDPSTRVSRPGKSGREPSLAQDDSTREVRAGPVSLCRNYFFAVLA